MVLVASPHVGLKADSVSGKSGMRQCAHSNKPHRPLQRRESGARPFNIKAAVSRTGQGHGMAAGVRSDDPLELDCGDIHRLGQFLRETGGARRGKGQTVRDGSDDVSRLQVRADERKQESVRS